MPQDRSAIVIHIRLARMVLGQAPANDAFTILNALDNLAARCAAAEAADLALLVALTPEGKGSM
jgi:hypothetical protein